MRHPADVEKIIKFYPYQQAWMRDESRFKIQMQARQTGKSYGNGGEIVDDCIQAEIARLRARWVILSRGERQAKEVMDEVIKPMTKAYYTIYGGLKGTPEFYEDVYTDPETKVSYKSLEVAFPNGSRITALPSNPDTARGFSANVFLDEFAFHIDSRAIWKALFPVISKPGLKLRIASTPNGTNNKFYELMTGKSQAWSRHVTDIYQAVEQGLPRDINELREGIDDEEAWAQEYELKFIDESTAWLDYDLINTCEHDDAGLPELYEGGSGYFGNDIGRRNDLWALIVGEMVGDVLWVRDVRTLQKATFTAQAAEMDDCLKNYHIVRGAMDQTGMGEVPTEFAQTRYGQSRVEGVLFTNKIKQELAIILKQAFEDRKIRIPRGHQQLRSHLHKLKKLVTPMGHPRFDADRDTDGHADLAWTLALMLYAAKNYGGPVEYKSAGKRRYAASDDYDYRYNRRGIY